MQNKPWTIKEGFLAGGGLIVAGLLMQWSIGPTAWDVFAWPVNGIVLAVFVAMIAGIHLCRGKVRAFRFLSTYQAAVPAMCYAVALTIVMGLTRQEEHGRWIDNMLSFWPFVLTYVYMALIVGLVVQKGGLRLKSPGKLTAALMHLGLFITMTTATLGNADMQRVKMIAAIGEPEWRALDEKGHVRELPMKIELKRFIMETYDDGSPKRFASEIEIRPKGGGRLQATVDVNKPAEVDGWKIYQYGYDTEMGAGSNISILELVSDPWLPYVYTGIYLMLAGGLLMMVTGARKGKEAKK